MGKKNVEHILPNFTNEIYARIIAESRKFL